MYFVLQSWCLPTCASRSEWNRLRGQVVGPAALDPHYYFHSPFSFFLFLTATSISPLIVLFDRCLIRHSLGCNSFFSFRTVIHCCHLLCTVPVNLIYPCGTSYFGRSIRRKIRIPKNLHISGAACFSSARLPWVILSERITPVCHYRLSFLDFFNPACIARQTRLAARFLLYRTTLQVYSIPNVDNPSCRHWRHPILTSKSVTRAWEASLEKQSRMDKQS